MFPVTITMKIRNYLLDSNELKAICTVHSIAMSPKDYNLKGIGLFEILITQPGRKTDLRKGQVLSGFRYILLFHPKRP